MSVPSGPAVDNPRRSDLRTCPLLRASEALLATRATSQEHKRPTVYTEAMEVFHRAADLIGLDRRGRVGVEGTGYEHIFYVTVKLHTRLIPLGADPKDEQDKYKDLKDRELPPDGLEPLLDGSFVF